MDNIAKAKEFNELFNIVFKDGLKKVALHLKNNGYVSSFMDYPIFDNEFKSGMPSFKSNFDLSNNDAKYLDYSSLFGKYTSKDNLIDIGKLKGFMDLKEFIEKNKELKELLLIFDDSELKYSIFYGLISDFIGGYVYKYGTIYNKSKYNKILCPILNYLFSRTVYLDIFVPILLLNIEVDSYKLNSNMKIVKMKNNFQLSRTNVRTFSYTTKDIIEGCAKYALKIENYYLDYPINNYLGITDSLKQFDYKTKYIINSFFIATFLETATYNGYAQIISVPQKWYFFLPKGDLINIHFKSYNNYPSYLEDGSWNNEVECLSIKQLNKVKDLFNKIIDSKNKSIELSIDRLFRALLRENHEDAFLDILIGIEILLTDDEKTEVTYKLAIRVAYIMNKLNKVKDVDYKGVMKELYKYRSAIVHGNSNKDKLSVSKTLNKDCYNIALDIFRQILKSIILKDNLLNSNNIPSEVDNMIMKEFLK